jgi:hypothetical protein
LARAGAGHDGRGPLARGAARGPARRGRAWGRRPAAGGDVVAARDGPPLLPGRDPGELVPRAPAGLSDRRAPACAWRGGRGGAGGGLRRGRFDGSFGSAPRGVPGRGCGGSRRSVRGAWRREGARARGRTSGGDASAAAGVPPGPGRGAGRLRCPGAGIAAPACGPSGAVGARAGRAAPARGGAPVPVPAARLSEPGGLRPRAPRDVAAQRPGVAAHRAGLRRASGAGGGLARGAALLGAGAAACEALRRGGARHPVGGVDRARRPGPGGAAR